MPPSFGRPPGFLNDIKSKRSGNYPRPIYAAPRPQVTYTSADLWASLARRTIARMPPAVRM